MYILFSVDYDLEKLNSLKLIGRTPNDNNEIIINKVLAIIRIQIKSVGNW